jgi:hypothetical protein
VEKLGGEQMPQHRIAEELQSLVVRTGGGVFVQVTGMGDGLPQQFGARENVAKPDLEGDERISHDEALE